jgi:hypothetical protein
LDSSSETVDQASSGVNEIWFDTGALDSDGAGNTVTDGVAVTVVDVGYAAVVTPYGFIQYTPCFASPI